MPPLSLVVCLFREGDLLERLLSHCAGCFDDLVVVHDGPDDTNVRAVVERNGGRFFERPRAYQQEPHWPFAWGEAKHDWILRLDADEFPSEALQDWLRAFRVSPDPAISGYTCVWPLWNGQKAITSTWPGGRNFLFNKHQVRQIGMVESTPVPDGRFEPLNLILHHQPKRKSFGVRNILFREQAYCWRRVIIQSLMGAPLELACWRWDSPEWPEGWETIRRHPLRSALVRLVWFPLCNARSHWKSERKIVLSNILNPGLHHFLLCVGYFWHSRVSKRRPANMSNQS